jgi:hypothetical protein
MRHKEPLITDVTKYHIHRTGVLMQMSMCWQNHCPRASLCHAGYERQSHLSFALLCALPNAYLGIFYVFGAHQDQWRKYSRRLRVSEAASRSEDCIS